jgi:hypothetical protein
MDTAGHEECAKQAGEPLIHDALERSGRKDWRTSAFYLGNWITDVQQIVDPIAVQDGQKKLLGALDTLLETLLGLKSEGWQDWLRQGAINFFGERRTQLTSAFKWALTGGRESPLFKTVKSGFFVSGYFKFVHPEKKGGKARMNFRAFEHIINKVYRQYYPHEHLDRWPVDRSAPSFKRTKGTVTDDKRGNGSSTLEPHLYEYLRNHVQITASLLGKIDRDWAQHAFGRGSKWENDEDKEWNLELAQLGHALHACEDFFAHSNFIELAIQGLPEEKRNRLKPHGDEPIAGLTGPQIFDRRLCRYSGDPDHPDGGPETWVVTGTFDFVDTFFSMRHAYEEIFGQSDHKPPDVLGHGSKVGQFMLDMIKSIRRDAGSRKLSREDARKAAVAALQRAATQGDDPDVREVANILLKEVPDEVRNAFLDTVAGFAQTIPDNALSLLDLFEFINILEDAFKYPLNVLEWLARDIAPDAARWVVGQVKKPIDRAIQGVVDDILGRNRIGCHSLMAKDYAGDDEGLNRIYNQAKDCAKAVHWYVVKTLTRWSEKAPLDVCRAESGAGPDSSQTSSTDQCRSIDWLELLETFLRHPHQAVRRNNHFWWEPILMDSSDGWKKFPGYSGTRTGRRPGLPHTPLSLKPGERAAQLKIGEKMRVSGEKAYDSSG